MPINKFKFVSPGVQVAEIDNSQRPAEPAGSGPAIIGRARRGPAMRPVQVDSFSEFVNIFGMPWAGNDTDDIWRNGNMMAPSYGVYAAQAYLRNSSPAVFVRLLGRENEEAGATQGLGAAGWIVGTDSTTTANGGNYGLFLINSSSVVGNQTTGTLAAIFHTDEGAVTLTGSGLIGTAEAGTSGLIQTVGTNYELKARILNNAGLPEETISFNFNRNSDKYIRKVFNTNPTTLTERISGVSGSDAHVFLAETFDRDVNTLNGDIVNDTAGAAFGVMLRLATSDGNVTQNNQLREATAAESGWVVSQYLGLSSSFNVTDTNKVQPLFKVKSINAGAWEAQNLKVSIADVAPPTSPSDPYGTFTVELRKSDDNDAAPQFVERFGACNLNPKSANYVARKIGDKFVVWDAGEARYKEFGTYTNKSKYILIEAAENVALSLANEALLPFGFYGPPRWRTWSFNSASIAPEEGAGTAYATTFRTTVEPICADRGGTEIIWTDTVDVTCSLAYPTIHYRMNSRAGNLPSPRDAYWGYDCGRTGSINTYDGSNIDIVRPFPRGIAAMGDPTNAHMTQSVFNDNTGNDVPSIFTLDELRWYGGGAGRSNADWFPGSHVDGTSINTTGSGAGVYREVLDAGFDRFALPLFGGFDGENILEADPFNANRCEANPDPVSNYVYNSVKMAIDTVADPEVVNTNAMVVPGNYCAGITSHLLQTCEKRADSLAIIDLEGGYIPKGDMKPSLLNGVPQNIGSVAQTITALRDRGLNTSYGCAYYPWVQIRDEESSQLLYAPASIAALGTFSSAQKKSEVWFAPAGFTRGGLTEGSAGLPVVGVVERLNSNDRDSLYEANINPIATFPAEGIVIFGQKTLQVTPSALDRVNVRRLMIHIKKQISYMASRLLFDQNVQSTWDRFVNQAEPFLESIKQRLGLMDFKVVLDETTTTPDLIDRNIMYAKIFLKPARAVEFIAIDFVITNAGASFED